MSFSDWYKKNKKKEEEQQTAVSAAPNASISKSEEATQTSFSEWYKKQKKTNSTTVKPANTTTTKQTSGATTWINASKDLLNEVQQYYGTYHEDDEETYRGFQDRASELLANANTWRKQYSGDAEATAYINSVVDALSGAKDYALNSRKYYAQWDNENAYNYSKTKAEAQKMSASEIRDRIKKKDDGSSVAFYDDQGSAVTWDNLLRIKGTEERIAKMQNDPATKGAYDNLIAYDDDIRRVENAQFAISARLEGLPADKEYERDLEYVVNKYGIDPNLDMRQPLYELYMELADGTYAGMVKNKELLKNAGYDWEEVASYRDYFASKEEDAKLQESYKVAAKNYPVLSTVASIVSAPGQIADLAEDLVSMAKNHDAADDSILGMSNVYDNAATNFTGAMTSYVSDNINKAVSEATGQEWAGWLASTAYSGATSSLQSAATSAVSIGLFGPVVGKAISLGIQGSQAAASAFSNAVKNGSTNGEALALSISAGIAEGFFEKYSLDNFIKISGGYDATSLAGVLRGIFKDTGNLIVQGLVESSEEFATEVFNTLADDLISGDHSGYYNAINKYRMNGYSEADAKKAAGEEYIGNLLSATIGGFFGGVSSGAVPAVTNAVGRTTNAVQYQNEVIKPHGGAINTLGGKDTLTALAKENVEEGSSLEKAIAKAEKKPSDKNIGKISVELERAMEEQNVSEIASDLERKGMDADEAESAARIILKEYNGEGLTEEDKAELYEMGIGEAQIESAVETIREKSGNGIERRRKELFAARTGAKAEATTENSIKAETGSETEKKQPTEDTKTTVTVDGKKAGANVKGIASIEGGKVSLELENGEVVDAADARYEGGASLVYQAAAEMATRVGGFNVDTANTFIKGYDAKSGQSASEYITGWSAAYKFGTQKSPRSVLSVNPYTAKLTQAQRDSAYNFGKIFGNESVESNTSKIASIGAINSEKIASTGAKTQKGRVHFDGSVSGKTLNEVQKSSLKALGVVADALGIDIHVFESSIGEDGCRQGANGWYDPKDNSIHIDLYSGVSGRNTMLFTAAHELTHFIRRNSPEKFNAFADFLFEEYSKKFTSEDSRTIEELIQTRIKRLENNGRITSDMTEEEIYDLAYEEVVADFCEAMLVDSNAIEALARLKAKDESLFDKIKEFITKLIKRIKEAYKGLNPDSAEANYVRDMLDAAEKLQALWTEALVEAAETSDLVEIDADTESVAPVFSERTWTVSEYVTEREKTAKEISKALGVSMETAYKYIDDINSVARLIADDRVRLDYDPNLDDKATVLKPNSDYGYSIDMSTLCAKRLLFTGTFDAIQKAFPDRVFSSEDIVKIREMMQDRGYQVACGICYVESTRREIGRITQDFINSYKESQKTGNPMTRINSEGKVVELKKTKEQKKTTVDKSSDKFFADKDYTPTLADLNTTDIDLVKRDHPLVYEAYLNFMNARGQAKPKLLETRAEYKGEILKHFKTEKTVNGKNAEGGLRLQSFSDFEVVHMIDMMQIVMDMSRVGLMSQAYTKVPAFAEVFGDTGVKINLSLIAKDDGLDSNGNLIFDDAEGIDHKEAFKLRDQYSNNVGTVLVGKTDAHIIAAMADPRIDYIIPFHKSSWKESLYDALGLTGYADYTDTQHERYIDKSRGKAKDFAPSEYWDFSKSGDENAQIYLAKCREDGRIPKFPQFQGYPGYWKLLIDFKMYDNDGVGSPQEVVKPTFNTEASERILDEYKGGHKSFPVAKDVVEDFAKEYEDKPSGKKYSDRYLSAEENPDILSMAAKVESGNFKANEKVFLGIVPDAIAQQIQKLTGINVDGFKVAVEARQIEHILKDHGKQGLADRSMANPSHIAKMEYALNDPDDISKAGKTQAYTHMVNGRNRTVDTVLYEKNIGTKSYYVVQAVPDTKAKTLYIVTAFIGKEGYKKEAPQLINAKSLDATAKTGSVDTSTDIISQDSDYVNEKFSDRNIPEIEGYQYQKMVNHFGMTLNFDVAGYMLGNGVMLDFSGKHWGDDYSTTRQVDHRDIQEVLESENNGIDSMVNMIGNGNIRLMPEVGGINLAVMPNETQVNKLKDYIRHFRGEVIVDIDEVGGDTIQSFSYNKGTNPAAIIRDIKAYFESGTIPQTQAEYRQFLHSDRPADSLSNRSLLANALESAAQNDIERERLAEYKNNIDNLNKQEQMLNGLKEEISQIYKSTGKRDMDRLNTLRAEAEKTAQRINIYDGQLLRLESTKALKNLLEREKAAAYKAAKAEGRELVVKYRTRAETTEIRNKIKKFKTKLERSLLNPTDRVYIPAGLVSAIIDVCDLIDTDTPLYKKNGDINQSQVRRNITKERLAALEDQYAELKNEGYELGSEFDESIQEYLTRLRKEFGDTSLKEMTLEELTEMYDILNSINETLQDARKLIGKTEAKTIYEAADSIIKEQDKIARKRKKEHRSAIQEKNDNLANLVLSPVRNVERMSGYNESSELVELFHDFEKGVRKKNKFSMDVYKFFEKLTTGKNQKAYENAIYFEFGGKKYVDSRGKKFGITKMQMMQALLSYEREAANNKMNHLAGGGFSFADVDMLRKGELKKAISKEYEHHIAYTPDLIESFKNSLKNDRWAQSYMDAAREFFNVTAKNAINETYLALKHRIIAKDKNYIPFEVDRSFVTREIDAKDTVQQTINSYGMLKSLQAGAAQPIIISGLNSVIDRHIDLVGNVYGLAIPIRNFNKVWNVKSENLSTGPVTVKGIIEQNWGGYKQGIDFIEQTISDLQSPRKSTQSNLYRKIKSGYIGATFLLNLSVVTKQIGSLYSATSMLRWRGPVRMMGNLFYTMVNHKKISAEVDKYTATAWMRRQGMSDAELYTLLTESKKWWISKLIDKIPAALNPGKWITAMDSAVALSLWRYAKQDVKKTTKLKGEALMKATAEFYDSVIENTQSMTDVLHRPEIQKRDDILSESFGMFKTDLYQMAGQLKVAAGRFAAKKNGKNSKAVIKTVFAVLGSALWGQLMTSLFAMLRYKVDRYRDEETGDITVESWLKRAGFGLGGDLAGYVVPLGGSEFVGLIENFVYGESDDVAESITLSAVNDLVNSIQKAAQELKDTDKLSAKPFEDMIIKSLQVFGVPSNNISRIVKAVQLHAEDIANGQPWSFEAGAERSAKNYVNGVIKSMNAGSRKDAEKYFIKGVADKGESALKSQLGKSYQDGKISKQQTLNTLTIIFGIDSEEAEETVNKWTCKVVTGISYNDIKQSYLDGEITAARAAEMYVLYGGYSKEKAKEKVSKFEFYEDEGYEYDDRNKLFKDGELSATEYLDAAKTQGGKTDKEAKQDLVSTTKSAYKEGYFTRSEAVKTMVDYGGLSESDAEIKVRHVDLKKQYPSYEITEDQTETYVKKLESSGLSIPNYMEYIELKKDCDGEDKNGDGKADRNTKKAEIMEAIDSLPIPNSQKDALYYANGWAENGIHEAPWH